MTIAFYVFRKQNRKKKNSALENKKETGLE